MQIRDSLMRERLMATLSGFFGFLATIGLYGVISYMVVRRRNEIGIRMALGAGWPDVVRTILREAVMLLSVGLALGIAMALAATRAAAAMLYGLQPHDPVTLLMAVALLAVIAASASYCL